MLFFRLRAPIHSQRPLIASRRKMIQIRPEQIRAFDASVEDSLVSRIVQHLRAHHGDAVGQLPDDGLRDMVAQGLKRARKYGLAWESSLTTFVALMFEIAPNFDEHPAFQRILRDPSVPPDHRMDALGARITDAQWEQAEALHDSAAWFPNDE